MTFLTFIIADKEYAVDIERVREARRLGEITSIPKTPEYIEGVTYLRGRIIPLINLRKKMNLESKELGRTNRIIVSQIENHLVGFIVDKVTGVLPISPEQIIPTEEISKEAPYLIGLTRIRKNMLLVIDIEKLLTWEDKLSLERTSQRVELKKK